MSYGRLAGRIYLLPRRSLARSRRRMQDSRRWPVANTRATRWPFEQRIAVVETIQQRIVVIIPPAFRASFHSLFFGLCGPVQYDRELQARLVVSISDKKKTLTIRRNGITGVKAEFHGSHIEKLLG